ncbi:MAG: CapA family protein [Vicinamibacterales bacterium]
MSRVDRRSALKWMGTAAIAGAAAPRDSWLEQILSAQGPGTVDWAARVAALPQPAAGEIVIAAVGDMMISDPVSNRALPEARAMYDVIRAADVAFANCEQAVADQGALRGGFPQTAEPPMLDDFRASGLSMLSLANNHSFDLGEAGLLDWIEESRSRGFTVAGAGRTADEALAPGVMTVKGQRVGLLAFLCAADSDAMTLYRAGASKPGIGVIAGTRVQVPGSPLPLLLPHAADMQRMTDAVRRARANVDVLMVSLHQHWNLDLPPGANQRRPPVPAGTVAPAQLDSPDNQVAEGRRLICRAAIDAGADIIVGHGPHVLNGIEVYRGKPILYSLGHFYVSLLRGGRAIPRLQLSASLARLAESNFNLEEHRWAAIARIFVRGAAVTRVQLLPLYMDVHKDGLPYFPGEADSATVNGALATLSRPFNTSLRAAGWYREVAL